MTLRAHQLWLKAFYERRGWDELSAGTRVNFMTEEIGEVAKAIRKLELAYDHPGQTAGTLLERRENLQEELADVLDALLILADKYEIAADDLLTQSQAKLSARYGESR